jgi:hypothetical protein
MVPQRFNIGEIDGRNGMLAVAMAMSEGGSNVYVEPRTVRADLKGNARGGAKDTEWVFAFVIDSDADKGKGAVDLPLAPSLVVETSPGNSHFWFFLDQAVRPTQAEIIGKAIKAAAGGDANTGVITQPYRVAGSRTLSVPRKRRTVAPIAPRRYMPTIQTGATRQVNYRQRFNLRTHQRRKTRTRTMKVSSTIPGQRKACFLPISLT